MRLKGDKKTDIYAEKIIGYRCDWKGCHYISPKKVQIMTHLNCRHLKQKPFGCDNCKQSFISNHLLLQHKKIVHKVFNNPKVNVNETKHKFRKLNTNEILEKLKRFEHEIEVDAKNDFISGIIE